MDEEIHKAELVLDNIVLQRQVDLMKMQIDDLKKAIADLCLNPMKKDRVLKDETRQKWRFYHDHKNEVVDDKEDHVSWPVVKKRTDKLFYEQKVDE